MLGSASFSSSHQEAEETEVAPDLTQFHHHHQPYAQPSPSPGIHTRQLLITGAELISQSNFPAAHRVISLLSSATSPYGDSSDRLAHHFARALSLRLSRHVGTPTSAAAAAESPSSDPSLLQSSYLSLNQITPFIRFSHLTANQAILDALDGGGGSQRRPVHIVDFDIMHGVQWPPLMQALAADRNPPPRIRITGAGPDPDVLRRTGDRLSKFAQSLGLRFQFQALVLNNDEGTYMIPSAIQLIPDELVAVNLVMYLHRLIRSDTDTRELRAFLQRVRALNPRIVTVAEPEASHNHPVFTRRFVEALDHYGAVFESLEATLPPSSRERLAVETNWFGREISDIVASEGGSRHERHERFESWEVFLRSSGFTNVPLSPFALSQAKLLLRLHYPSEGYRLQVLNNSVFLGWQTRPLFSVSSWR